MMKTLSDYRLYELFRLVCAAPEKPIYYFTINDDLFFGFILISMPSRKYTVRAVWKCRAIFGDALLQQQQQQHSNFTVD